MNWPLRSAAKEMQKKKRGKKKTTMAIITKQTRNRKYKHKFPFFVREVEIVPTIWQGESEWRQIVYYNEITSKFFVKEWCSTWAEKKSDKRWHLDEKR